MHGGAPWYGELAHRDDIGELLTGTGLQEAAEAR